MKFTAFLLPSLLPAIALSASTIEVNVGQDGLVFSPSSVKAAPGTKINFNFFPGGHSVTQSTFSNPCSPSGSSSINSGFITSTPQVFTITVQDSNPIWLYCAQITHCQSGMAMVINPPSSGDTLDAYMKAASATPSSSMPSKVQGGVLGASGSGGGSGGGGGGGSGGAGSGSSSASSPYGSSNDGLTVQARVPAVLVAAAGVGMAGMLL